MGFNLFILFAGSILASTVQGVQEDVDIAVAAAKKAYKTWSKTSGHHRARILYRYLLKKLNKVTQ